MILNHVSFLLILYYYFFALLQMLAFDGKAEAAQFCFDKAGVINKSLTNSSSAFLFFYAPCCLCSKTSFIDLVKKEITVDL